jgi:hypothetical protein
MAMITRRELAPLYLGVLSGRVSLGELAETQSADPFVSSVIAAHGVSAEGADLAARTRYGDALDGSRRREAIRLLLWSLSRCSPARHQGPLEAFVGWIQRAATLRPSSDPHVDTWPFAQADDLRLALVDEGAELARMLEAAGFPAWCQELAWPQLSEP